VAFREQVVERFISEFGRPARSISKVMAWDVSPGLGTVLQLDSPKGGEAAHVWLPYPPDGQPVPELALEYPGEAGRHSNAYPSPGLERGKPALKLILRDARELDDAIAYIAAARAALPLPPIRPTAVPAPKDGRVVADPSSMPRPSEIRPRREAIPRAVQREVWQRDGGQCVECGTREKLCFDHIVPFSRGGSNSIRNLQLLCESCNCSKGNRI
jgi:hypothetical protein